jgi:hypothetical protein
LFALVASDFNLFAGNGAVHLIGGGLLYDLGGEGLFRRGDDGEGEGEIVLRVVTGTPAFFLHLPNY